MENTLVKIDPKEFGLEEKTGKTISEAFSPKIIEREQLTIIYEEIIKGKLSLVLSEQAGDLRKQLVKVRTGIASVHKVQKAFSLAYGKFCDAWKNQETLPITQMEEKLSEIEKYAENLEKEKLEKLQLERSNQISKYIEDASERDFSHMEVDVWNAFFVIKEKEYNEKIEAEKQAELKRIAEQEAEKERIAKIEAENKRLEKEAKEKERLAKIEKDKRDKAEKERLEKEKIEQDKRTEKIRIERLEQQKKQDLLNLKIAEEKEQKEKLEKELQNKKNAELKETKRIEAESKALLLAPDKDKLLKLATDLLSYPLPKLEAQEAISILNDVKVLINKISSHIKTKSENL